MTLEALKEQHRMIIGLNNGSSEDATKLSIEYAISVLKSVQEDIGAGLGREFAAQSIIKKINELKSLIK